MLTPPRAVTAHPQVRDAVAVIQYLQWLERTVPQGQVDEFSGAQRIDAFRWSVLPPGPALPREGQPGTLSTLLPPCCLPGPRSTAVGPASSPSQPAGSTQRWLTTGRAGAAMGSGQRAVGTGQGAVGNGQLGEGSDPPPSQPLQPEQPDTVCERDVSL